MKFVKIKVKSFFFSLLSGRAVCGGAGVRSSLNQTRSEKAIGEVKEACENIQRTTEHVRRKVEGMDIHAMMQRQERLCMSFAQEMYSLSLIHI